MDIACDSGYPYMLQPRFDPQYKSTITNLCSGTYLPNKDLIILLNESPIRYKLRFSNSSETDIDSETKSFDSIFDTRDFSNSNTNNPSAINRGKKFHDSTRDSSPVPSSFRARERTGSGRRRGRIEKRNFQRCESLEGNCEILENFEESDIQLFGLSDTTLLEETFNLFGLSGERSVRMTTTYNDFEAVAHLLEEKERDLELAAKIGKTLIARIRQLQNQNDTLEEQLIIANETISQLRYELKCKDKMLQIYISDDNDQSPTYSPIDNNMDRNYSLYASPCYNKSLKLLEEKTSRLEKENEHLQIETRKLGGTVNDFENRELELVDDFVQQFNEWNAKVQTLLADLETKDNFAAEQREELDSLIKDLEISKHEKKVMSKNMEELKCKLILSENYQIDLNKQLLDMQIRYKEAASMLHIIQENARNETLHTDPNTLNDQSKACCFYCSLINSSKNEVEMFGNDADRNASSTHVDCNMPFESSSPNQETLNFIAESGYESSINRIPLRQSYKFNNLLPNSDNFNQPVIPRYLDFTYDSTLSQSSSSISCQALSNASEDFCDHKSADNNYITHNKMVKKSASEYDNKFAHLKPVEKLVGNSKKMSYLRKLKLVKSLEGSITLSKWKTLASNSLTPLTPPGHKDNKPHKNRIDNQLQIMNNDHFHDDSLKKGILNRVSLPLNSSFSLTDLTEQKHYTHIWLNTHIKEEREAFLKQTFDSKNFQALARPRKSFLNSSLLTLKNDKSYKYTDNDAIDSHSAITSMCLAPPSKNYKANYHSMGLASILFTSQSDNLDKHVSKSTSSLDSLSTLEEHQFDHLNRNFDNLYYIPSLAAQNNYFRGRKSNLTIDRLKDTMRSLDFITHHNHGKGDGNHNATNKICRDTSKVLTNGYKNYYTPGRQTNNGKPRVLNIDAFYANMHRLRRLQRSNNGLNTFKPAASVKVDLKKSNSNDFSKFMTNPPSCFSYINRYNSSCVIE
ncbi:unnamed protein product [Gordionus sp. m RMFG-2023]